MVRLIILRIFESYFRHRWLYLLPIVLMIGVATIYFITKEPTYYAQGVLYVRKESLISSLNAITDPGGSWWITPAQETSSQITDLLQTDAFARAVINSTGLEAKMDGGPDVVENLINDVRSNIWVSAIGDNQLAIHATYEDPVITSQLVSAVLEGYVQWNVNSQRAETETAENFFAEIIQTYEADLNATRSNMEQYLLVHPEPIRGERSALEKLQLDRLQSEVNLAQERYAKALDKEENTQLASAQIETDARQTYILIDAPQLPTKPETSLRELAMNAGLFVVVGIVITIGAVVGAALLDRSFFYPADVQNWLQLPVLAMVPDTSPVKKRSPFKRRKPNEQKAIEADMADPAKAIEPEMAAPAMAAPAMAIEPDPDVPTKAIVTKTRRKRKTNVSSETTGLPIGNEINA